MTENQYRCFSYFDIQNRRGRPKTKQTLWMSTKENDVNLRHMILNIKTFATYGFQAFLPEGRFSKTWYSKSLRGTTGCFFDPFSFRFGSIVGFVLDSVWYYLSSFWHPVWHPWWPVWIHVGTLWFFWVFFSRWPNAWTTKVQNMGRRNPRRDNNDDCPWDNIVYLRALQSLALRTSQRSQFAVAYTTRGAGTRRVAFLPLRLVAHWDIIWLSKVTISETL